MNILLDMVLPTIILFFILSVIPIFGFPTDKQNDLVVPITIKMASWVEVLFGVIVFFFWVSVGASVIDPSDFGVNTRSEFIYGWLACILFGILWLLLATHLNYGSVKARKICLVLSLLRFATVFGAPFSLFSLYLLYFPKKSRSYYKTRDKNVSYG